MRPPFLVPSLLLVAVAGCGSSGQPPASSGAPHASTADIAKAAAQSDAASPLPPASTPLPPPASPTLVAYLEGLDDLTQGRWPDSVTAFSRALEASGDDATFVLARGVAETLAEQFEPAMNDLKRAKALGLRTREPDLWIWACSAMSGPAVVSIPGHVAQGGQDYPTGYGSFITYDLAMNYQHLRLPADSGGAGNPDAVKQAPMRAVMVTAGQWFANRGMRRGDLAAAHLSRAGQLHDAGKYQAALREIDFARTAYPGNAELAYMSADSWLALGRPATARRDFTLALTLRTTFAAAYLGRAAAAARLGDRTRATADLAVAARLDSASAGQARGAIETDLSKMHVDATPESAMADLDRAAQSNSPVEQLIDLAARVHKAEGERRLRYDEIYQDRVRTLEDAVRASPKNPDRLVELARYIASESENRGEAVEPRRVIAPYRIEPSRDTELSRAVQIADLALRLNARHAGAMIVKAVALLALKKYDDADRLADQALSVSGDNPDALRLYARFRADRANQMSAQAAILRQDRCTSSSHDEDRGSYIDHITTTTCYPPSAADQSRAAQLDAMAAELRRRARAALEKAIAVSKGTVEGFLIEADLAEWDGRMDAALAALQQAVKLDPKSLEAQDELVQFYASTGQKDLAEEQQVIERQLIHTTAAPLLRLAWARSATTAWSGASAYLARARQLDPEDARVPAYLGVALAGQGKAADADVQYREALALEEARIRLDDQAAGAGEPMSRDPIDFALAMELRFRLADSRARAGDAAAAVDLYLANAGYRSRVQPADFSREMFPALLPDARPTGGAVVVAPENAATLLARSNLYAGKALQALGRKADALQQFQAAASFVPAAGSMTPRVGNSRGDTNFSGYATAAAGEALVELSKAALEAGQVDRARLYLQAATNAGSLPDNLRGELNDLNMAIARMLESQPAPQPAQTPEQQRAQAMQQQQDQARQQAMSQHMRANARVVPELVGTWDLVPDNKFLPYGKTLTIDAAANFTIVMQQDNRTTRGKVNAQQNGRASGNPTSGQMMLVSDTGAVDVLYYDFVSPTQMNITAQDGVKYVARRR